MAVRLNNSIMVRTLAADLGLRATADVVNQLVSYCHARVESFLRHLPGCSDANQLLQLVANSLGTTFREVRTDDDLGRIRAEFIERQEPGFIKIHEEFSGDVLGITLKLLRAHDWELPFVSLIDCRGDSARRAYFTKWHELGHLLILTDQTRLKFLRTHETRKTPEEALVDVIAGSLAFYPTLVRAHAKGAISFDAIESVHRSVWPEASAQAALLGITKWWPTPAILVEARLDYKASERPTEQAGFSFLKQPKRSLRAVHVTPNEAARKLPITTIPRFRVPMTSVIQRVFRDELEYGEAHEELTSWKSSDGREWSGGSVVVKARRTHEGVQALLLPARVVRGRAAGRH